MHVGSQYAISSFSDSRFKFPTIQKKLLEAWNWCLDQRVQKTDFLFLNGEPIDGAGEILRGSEVWTTDILESVNDAYRLLKKYNPVKFAATRGSGYHSDARGLSAEELIMERFADKAIEINPYMVKGTIDFKNDGDHYKHVHNFAFFDLYGVCFSLTHHIRTSSSFMYKTTTLARELLELTVSIDKWLPKNYHYNKLVVVRSHVHDFCEVRYGSQLGFKTPAWKLPDWYLLKKGLGGITPHIGTVEVIVESNGEILVAPHIVETSRYPKVNVLNLIKLLNKR